MIFRDSRDRELVDFRSSTIILSHHSIMRIESPSREQGDRKSDMDIEEFDREIERESENL